MYVDWIKRAIAEKRTTQSKIAKHLGLSPSAINRLVQGTRQLKAREIPLVAALIGLPPGTSGVQQSELPDFDDVPVMGMITMTQWSASANTVKKGETVTSVEPRFPIREQLAYAVSPDVRSKDPDLGTHVFTVSAEHYRPRPLAGDRFVLPQTKDGLHRQHIFTAEFRGSMVGTVLVGMDGTEITAPFPPGLRWVIASHDIKRFA